jgi:FdhD protein
MRALVVGFLAAEGIIDTVDDIKDIAFVYDSEETLASVELHREARMRPDSRRKTLTSGCAHGVTFRKALSNEEKTKATSTFCISSERISHLMTDMQAAAQLFQDTGGAHTVALADRTNLIFTAEDIGRHNAMDKVIGQALLSNLSLEDKILLVSGRISSELAIKAVRQRIPIVASRAAPTLLAVEIARECNLTLAGFVRGNRMNVYSGEQRISEAV